MSIYIHSENISFQISQEEKVKQLIHRIIKDNNLLAENVNIILTNDDTLLNINKTYRNKYYYTDVISFVYSAESHLEGDVFISIDTVKENAVSFNKLFFNELLRVIIHGVLHLVGYEDDTEDKKQVMHDLEDKYIVVFDNILL